MSRVGKNPVVIPEGVQVAVSGREISISGKGGQMSWSVPDAVKFEHAENEITFTPRQTTKDAQAKWGLSRALVQNMVLGVTEGFEKKLEIRGVGYRANVAGTTLNLNVGYSHPVAMAIPQGLTVTVEGNTQITVKGADKQMVGQFAAEVRATRPPEPYKGKGVRYADEFIVMKEGKKK